MLYGVMCAAAGWLASCRRIGEDAESRVSARQMMCVQSLLTSLAPFLQSCEDAGLHPQLSGHVGSASVKLAAPRQTAQRLKCETAALSSKC